MMKPSTSSFSINSTKFEIEMLEFISKRILVGNIIYWMAWNDHKKVGALQNFNVFIHFFRVTIYEIGIFKQ